MSFRKILRKEIGRTKDREKQFEARVPRERERERESQGKRWVNEK